MPLLYASVYGNYKQTMKDIHNGYQSIIPVSIQFVQCISEATMCKKEKFWLLIFSYVSKFKIAFNSPSDQAKYYVLWVLTDQFRKCIRECFYFLMEVDSEYSIYMQIIHILSFLYLSYTIWNTTFHGHQVVRLTVLSM
jgi:hypothetical protein